MNLRQERMKMKLTVEQLSQAARIEADTLRAYEYGTVEIKPAHLERIKNVLNNGTHVYRGRVFADS